MDRIEKRNLVKDVNPVSLQNLWPCLGVFLCKRRELLKNIIQLERIGELRPLTDRECQVIALAKSIARGDVCLPFAKP